MGEDAQKHKCPKCGHAMACREYSYVFDRLKWKCFTCNYEMETYPNDKSPNEILKEKLGEAPPKEF